MLKKSLTCLILIMGLTISSRASDLYLMTISGDSELALAQEVVHHAYGTIGGRFIVELDLKQYEALINGGVDCEFMTHGFAQDEIYVVKEGHSGQANTIVALSPYYHSENEYLIRLSEGSPEILSREGFLVIPVGVRQTPLFAIAEDVPHYVIHDQYTTDSIAAYVELDSLESYIQRMQNFYTRFIGSDSSGPAKVWLRSKYEEIGYTHFNNIGFGTGETWCGSYSGMNVICVKEGSVEPEKVIIVGGHFDSIRYPQSCNDENSYSPGADDNASGSAGVLEMARVLKDFDNNKTILFVAFDGEELGLHGAYAMANQYYNEGIDVELVINMDMIGYTTDTIPDVKIIYSQSEPMNLLMGRTGAAVSGLIPEYTEGAMSSDDGAFVDYGFKTIGVHEHEFNYPGWHTSRDVIYYINLDYVTDIVKMATATVAAIDRTPDPLEFSVNDFGNGQSVRISWEVAEPDIEYVAIYGPLETFLPDTVPLASGTSHHDIFDMYEGQPIFVSVYHIVDGIPQMTFSMTEISSNIVPRAPLGLIASPDSVEVNLVWDYGVEFDLDYYRVFKKAGEGEWEILADNYNGTSLLDQDVIGQTEYSYRLTVVDNDGHESDSSDITSCFLASFDAGVLIVDETHTGDINPTEQAQSVYYNNMMGDNPHTIVTVEQAGDYLSHGDMGKHNPMFWIDDDNQTHIWMDYIDSLNWYFDYENDFLLAGWRSLTALTGNTNFYSGSFIHDRFGISSVGENILMRFVGANGEGDWPDLVVDPSAPNEGHLDFIQVIFPQEGAETIYQFETDPYHIGYQDKSVGIAYDTRQGKRVMLGFPLYWLTPESAEALVTRVLQYFDEVSPPVFGDCNGDYRVNILDVTYLINYVYMSGEPPIEMNHGDPNGDCAINILDVTYAISYLYQGGASPVAGCVE